jgi:hypothetical protein
MFGGHFHSIFSILEKKIHRVGVVWLFKMRKEELVQGQSSVSIHYRNLSAEENS